MCRARGDSGGEHQLAGFAGCFAIALPHSQVLEEVSSLCLPPKGLWCCVLIGTLLLCSSWLWQKISGKSVFLSRQRSSQSTSRLQSCAAVCWKWLILEPCPDHTPHEHLLLVSQMAGCQNYWKMQSDLTWWPRSTWPLLLHPGAIHTPKETYAKNSILSSIFILAVLSVIQSDMFPFHSESQERRGLFTVVPEGLSWNKWAENEQGK